MSKLDIDFTTLWDDPMQDDSVKHLLLNGNKIQQLT